MRQYNSKNFGYFRSLSLHSNEARKGCSKLCTFCTPVINTKSIWLVVLSSQSLWFPLQRFESMPHDRKSKNICYLLCKSYFTWIHFTLLVTLLRFLSSITITKRSSNNKGIVQRFSVLIPTNFSEEKPNSLKRVMLQSLMRWEYVPRQMERGCVRALLALKAQVYF